MAYCTEVIIFGYLDTSSSIYMLNGLINNKVIR